MPQTWFMNGNTTKTMFIDVQKKNRRLPTKMFNLPQVAATQIKRRVSCFSRASPAHSPFFNYAAHCRHLKYWFRMEDSGQEATASIPRPPLILKMQHWFSFGVIQRGKFAFSDCVWIILMSFWEAFQCKELAKRTQTHWIRADCTDPASVSLMCILFVAWRSWSICPLKSPSSKMLSCRDMVSLTLCMWL